MSQTKFLDRQMSEHNFHKGQDSASDLNFYKTSCRNNELGFSGLKDAKKSYLKSLNPTMMSTGFQTLRKNASFSNTKELKTSI